jgi:hypothetical protein
MSNTFCRVYFFHKNKYEEAKLSLEHTCYRLLSSHRLPRPLFPPAGAGAPSATTAHLLAAAAEDAVATRAENARLSRAVDDVMLELHKAEVCPLRCAVWVWVWVWV